MYVGSESYLFACELLLVIVFLFCGKKAKAKSEA